MGEGEGGIGPSVYGKLGTNTNMKCTKRCICPTYHCSLLKYISQTYPTSTTRFALIVESFYRWPTVPEYFIPLVLLLFCNRA
jgi:hypothetical protein